MENLRLRETASTSVNVTVGKRGREYLTDREVERLIEAAKQNRSGHRDATAILVAYRHGLRASELVALRWDDIDLATGRLHVRRAKGGDASVHPISARESRALRKLLREAPTSPYVFISERRAPSSVAGYQRMVARAGVAAKFTFLVHSHMLRHACGFKLANDGHDTRAIQAYLGHRSIMSTVRYTALTPHRFKNFWKDQLSNVSYQTTMMRAESDVGEEWIDEHIGDGGHHVVRCYRHRTRYFLDIDHGTTDDDLTIGG